MEQSTEERRMASLLEGLRRSQLHGMVARMRPELVEFFHGLALEVIGQFKTTLSQSQRFTL